MENKTIPYILYESTQARTERTTKRLIIALIIATALIFISNALWLWAWSSYDYVSEEIAYQQDGHGINNINTGAQDNVRYHYYEPESND